MLADKGAQQCANDLSQENCDSQKLIKRNGASSPPSIQSLSQREPDAPRRASGEVVGFRNRSRRVRSNEVESGDLSLAVLGSSPAAQQIRDWIRIFGPEEEPVLICGETGVGKEYIAAALHQHSLRRGERCVVKNVGRVDRELIGSEFFGHVKGAFTGAGANRAGAFVEADGGVIFLDEIGDMPLDLQVQLLRVIEDGVISPVGADEPREVDVRVIAATHRNLADRVGDGVFREDLYYRLDVLRIDVPPLRERGDDVVEIADMFLAQRRAQTGKALKLTSEAADILLQHRWPGNLRELRNVVTRAAVLSMADDENGRDIAARHLSISLPESFGCDITIAEARRLATLFVAAKALDCTGGNVSKAAKLAQVNRSSFHEHKKELEESGLTSADLTRMLTASFGL